MWQDISIYRIHLFKCISTFTKSGFLLFQREHNIHDVLRQNDTIRVVGAGGIYAMRI